MRTQRTLATHHHPSRQHRQRRTRRNRSVVHPDSGSRVFGRPGPRFIHKSEEGSGCSAPGVQSADSETQIAGILGVNPSLITRSLRHLHSVLLVPNEDSKEIRVFHKSFPDFLQDPGRCSDPNFFIDAPVHHGDIALDCLELLKKLKLNPCDLPDFAMNRDVASLPELLEDKVGSATRYVCGYWAMHLRSSPTTDDYASRLISSATEFFEKNAISWIEVMSLENKLESVIYNIYNLFYWLGMVCKIHRSNHGSLTSSNRLTSLSPICAASRKTTSDSRCISSTPSSNLRHTYTILLYPFRRSHPRFTPGPSVKKPESLGFTGSPKVGESSCEPSKRVPNISPAWRPSVTRLLLPATMVRWASTTRLWVS